MEKNSRPYKVQLITPQGAWKYVANAWPTKDSGFNIVLDPGVTLTGGQKLHLRPPRGSAPAASPTQDE
jgi:hypothetical protein